MSGIAYDPPIEDVPIFDASLFVVSSTSSSGSYLNFPTAQGTENLQAINVNGIATFNALTKVLGSQFYIRDNDGAPTSNMTFNPSGNNPSFSIASSGTGLTIGADTTCNIQLQGTNKTLNIATTQSNTDLNIGTGPRTLAVVHNYSDGDNAVAGSNVHFNNGLLNQSNTNIHNGASSLGTVNIATGSGSGTTINIGNAISGNTTTNLIGATYITTALSNSLQATTLSSAVSLYSTLETGNLGFAIGQTTGQLDIGNRFNRSSAINFANGSQQTSAIGIANGSQQTSILTIGNETTGNTTNYMYGNTIISKPQINTLQATTTGTSVFLYSSLTTGPISFATGQTSGQLEIGSQASRSGAINIGTGASSTSLITIGSTNTNTTMLGTTKINTLQTTAAATNAFVYGNLAEGAIFMGANQTSGAIQIGSSTSRTGAVEIANATRGNISIGAGMLTAGTNNISIGTANLGKTGIKASNIYLNETGTGQINLGNSTTTAITHYKPITPNYNSDYSATTGTGSGKIGEVLKVGPVAVALTAGVPKTLLSATIPIGVWMLQGQAGTAANYSGYNIITFSTVDNALQFQGASNIATYGYDLNLNISWVFSLTSATPYYLVAQTAVGGTWGNIYFQAIRIA
jgi:hypothetical protein